MQEKGRSKDAYSPALMSFWLFPNREREGPSSDQNSSSLCLFVSCSPSNPLIHPHCSQDLVWID